MTRSRSMRGAGCAITALLLSGPIVSSQATHTVMPDAHGFIAAQPEDLTPGLILGDPSKPGMYVTRIRFAPNSGSKPHFHTQDRLVTVIKGTWWVALGPDASVYDPDKMVPMKAGSFVFHPARGVHYDEARDEEAIVQIIGMGPVESTRIESPSGGNQ